ncbi:glycosyltransferase [Rhodococcus sp. NPDC003318]|uniref:glycosyltransferase n=1 Tax=Rhodococcus sp. NPDC003318 TaxID=3364503 RepID=UPI00368838AF
MASRERTSNDGRLRIVTVGRISAQKDPLFLARVAQLVDVHSVAWMWVGDGDPALKAALLDSGIEVTGWVPNTEALALIAGADLYFHPASWEGAPMTLLEAAAVGTAVLTRNIDTLCGLGFVTAGETSDQAAETIRKFIRDAEFRTSVRNESLRTVSVHSAYAQRRALAEIYGREGEGVA